MQPDTSNQDCYLIVKCNTSTGKRMTDVQKRFIKSFVVTSVIKLTCEKRKIDFGSRRKWKLHTIQSVFIRSSLRCIFSTFHFTVNKIDERCRWAHFGTPDKSVVHMLEPLSLPTIRDLPIFQNNYKRLPVESARPRL